MKKLLLLIIFLALGFGGYFAWNKYVIPLEEQYKLAIGQYESGQYALALPALIKAYKADQKDGTFPEAELMLARCETALDSKNVGRWNNIINTSTSKLVIAEGRYNMVLVKPTLKAKEAYANDFPTLEQSQAFLIELGDQAQAQGEITKALDYWQKVINNFPVSPLSDEVLLKVSAQNTKLHFSQAPTIYSVQHQVTKNEYLSTIAKKYGSFVDSIKRINGLKSDIIRLNSRLKVDCSKYEILIDISDNTLTLKRIWEGSTNFVKRYSVGTGKTDNTPRGIFKIDLKQKEPVWYKGGGKPIPYNSPDNLLGTRWMGIDCPGFGIHGTWDPESIGKASSAGCIRMKNEEVEELYDIVPYNTTVKIQD